MPAESSPHAIPALPVPVPAAPRPADRALVPAAAPPSAVGEAAFAAAKAYARLALAPATCRAYQADWMQFITWCAAANLPALPAAPATVGAYLATPARRDRPDAPPARP